MKTLAWGSIPNNVRCWCAAQMMSHKAEMTNDAVVVVKMRVDRDELPDPGQTSTLVYSRVNSTFARVTGLKPLWFAVASHVKHDDLQTDITLVFHAPGMINSQIDRVCHHLGRLFKAIVVADRYDREALAAMDFRVMFGGLEDNSSVVTTTRETMNLTIHQVHVEVARESSAAEAERAKSMDERTISQIEIPLEIQIVDHVLKTNPPKDLDDLLDSIDIGMVMAQEERQAAAVAATEKPSIKDNWIVGWQLVGTSIKQALYAGFTRLSLGKSFTH